MGAPLIILAAGGTGGHMMPAEAVAEKLKERGMRVALVTDTRGVAIGNMLQDIDKTVLPATSHMGGGILGKIKFIFGLMRSTRQVKKLYRQDKPAVVVGFGGYPSLPAVVAAKNMGIPYVLHEQNAVLGRVNRIMAKGAKKIALTFEGTRRVPVGCITSVTGNPVRASISALTNIAYSVPFGVGSIRIFIIGGSQGARILSDVVPAAIAQLSEAERASLDFMHQARPEDVERVQDAYAAAGVKAEVQSYFDDVGSILSRTHLVIARSGASTLAELMAMGRPAILVPLAIAADDHQSINAQIAEFAGGAWVMSEARFTAAALKKKLQGFLRNMTELQEYSDNMRSIARLEAADALEDLIIAEIKKEQTL